LSYYPRTTEELRKIILGKFPKAKPEEHRNKCKYNFIKDPAQIAERLLWKLQELETGYELKTDPIFAARWIGHIGGMMEAMRWLHPVTYAHLLHEDHSVGKD